jgi:predicted nucleic acid-binding protein
MGIKKAVSNTCPIIHLSEIGCFHCLGIVDNLLIPKSVESEIRSKNAPGKNELKNAGWITTRELDGIQKEKAGKISKDFGIELADAEAIVLARANDIKLLFTDDKSAREIAEYYGLEVHGSAGIIARAYRSKILSYEEVKDALDKLHKQSSLFITDRVYKMVLDLIEMSKHERK